MGLLEPCRYLGVSTKGMLLLMVGRADTRTRCAQLVEAFDARDFSAGDLDPFAAALAKATYRITRSWSNGERYSIGGIHAALPLARFVGLVKPRLSELTIDGMIKVTGIFKRMLAKTAISYVDMVARAPGGFANIDACHDLETVCDMAILAGVPPVVVAAALAFHGRLDDAMYDRVVTANMDLVSGLDFPLLMGLGEAAGRVEAHRPAAERAAHMPDGAFSSPPRPYRNAPMAFLLDSTDPTTRVHQLEGIRVALGDYLTVDSFDNCGEQLVFAMVIDASGKAVMRESVMDHVRYMHHRHRRKTTVVSVGMMVGHRVFVAVMNNMHTPFEARLMDMRKAAARAKQGRAA